MGPASFRMHNERRHHPVACGDLCHDFDHGQVLSCRQSVIAEEIRASDALDPPMRNR